MGNKNFYPKKKYLKIRVPENSGSGNPDYLIYGRVERDVSGWVLGRNRAGCSTTAGEVGEQRGRSRWM